MMDIRIEGIGKQFSDRWLFRHIQWDSQSGKRLALVGPNGSGKSTLLRILAGQVMPTEGRVFFSKDGKQVPQGRVYQHLSWSAPYLELLPDLTLEEQVRLHFRFKKPLLGSGTDLIALMDLEAHRHKPIRYFSSGMNQRLKAGLAIFSDCSLILLDEPTSNLDKANTDKVLRWLEEYQGDRYCFLASNLEREFDLFPEKIHLRGQS